MMVLKTVLIRQIHADKFRSANARGDVGAVLHCCAAGVEDPEAV